VGVQGQILRVHGKVYKATGGRVGHKVLGVPCLMLTSTGRRSGQIRTNSLVYARDGQDYLVVASKGGDPKAPGWYHNLKANPDVEIQIGRERRKAKARVIEFGDPDYNRVWQIVNENNHDRYSGYQQRTSRPIPVVALTPS